MYGRQLFSLLERNGKKKCIVLVCLMVLFSFVEVLSLALIIPYIQILQDPSIFLEYSSITTGLKYLGINITTKNALSVFTTGFLGIFVLRTALFALISYSNSKLSYDFFSNIAQRLQRKYLGLDLKDFLMTNSNLLVKNCTRTAETVGDALVIYLQYFSSIIITIVVVALIMLINPIVSLFLFGVFSSVMMLMLKSFKKAQEKGGEIRERELEVMHRLAAESFTSFKDIQLYNKESHFFKLFDDSSNSYGKALRLHTFFLSLPAVILELVAVLIMVTAVSYSIYTDKSMSTLVPHLLFYAAVIKRLLPNVHKIVMNRVILLNYIASIDLVKSELTEFDSGKKVNFEKSLFQNYFEFKRVNFSYIKSENVLRDVSFSIIKNHTTAFVGHSGSGKSTLIEILCSLLGPDSGEIILDGRKVVNLQGIKHLIGYVPQVVNLLDASIAENIAFGESFINMKKLYDVLKMTHLEDFIKTLPQGVNTKIGERGMKLSGGQRQRVGIARALYFDPEILIFDEATSSLDNMSEKIISKTIEEVAGQKTIIAIAHRLTTVQNFDKIFVMHQGKIIASGSHQELLEDCHVYSELYHCYDERKNNSADLRKEFVLQNV